MKAYSIIPHTADVRLKIEADTLPELFESALEGMNRILKKNYEKHLNKHAIIKKISVSSSDSTSALIDFLSEVLTLSHVHKAIFYNARFTNFAANSLKAELTGVAVESFTEDIKAVTYHEAEIRKNEKGKLETIIVFDI